MVKFSSLVLWPVWLSFFLFNCGTQLNSSRKTQYTFIEWNSTLQDSLRISFSIDSIFKPGPKGITCSDDGSSCYVFKSDSCEITMNQWILFKEYPRKSLETMGESFKIKLKGAFPEAVIQEPEIISSTMLKGIMTESTVADRYIIGYHGVNEEMFLDFNIQLISLDSKKNYKDILLSLINSMSIQRKE